MKLSDVVVLGLPLWMPLERLLGGAWGTTTEGDGTVTARAERSPVEAADVAARLRGLGFGGRALEVQVAPALPRALVREARTTDARRRRDTTPGFTRPGTRLDDEGRMSLTPEVLALRLGERARGRRVVDLGCGCGGNAIGFARGGAHVIAVERDAPRLAMARHNARVYGVSIDFRAGDDAVLEALTGDILFVDPPWGADYDRVRTGLNALPLLGRALAAPGFGEVWAKVPPSFATDEVPGGAVEPFFGEADGDRQRVKFLLVRTYAGGLDVT